YKIRVTRSRRESSVAPSGEADNDLSESKGSTYALNCEASEGKDGLVRILLQTSIAHADDDWHVGRFSLLAQYLRSFAEVTARNREVDTYGNDRVLPGLTRDHFDEVWLFG